MHMVQGMEWRKTKSPFFDRMVDQLSQVGYRVVVVVVDIVNVIVKEIHGAVVLFLVLVLEIGVAVKLMVVIPADVEVVVVVVVVVDEEGMVVVDIVLPPGEGEGSAEVRAKGVDGLIMHMVHGLI